MYKCICCNELQVDEKVNLGEQPPSNKFEGEKIETDRWPLILGKCLNCDIYQLIN